ncbi:hypothetical protein H6G33_19260 [Calothrix sp. FACHB-1219]|uniref:hypothetical protein n=1 Tax=unclassified Calothrix TaxID=2619626 RepID=UPI0016897DFC|nr:MULTISPECIES: hypothetical protein [unclassified Calothrix]MBD2206267.1 hypothetical protein [Calothrix sp. FACHB-168]MBD2219163.1 hypothetical protein [Calothrix sp. FACHB-1219]
MLTITWQEEIASLKLDLNKEINQISRNSEINIPNYICINNLKSKLERLEEIEKILSIDKYKIAFIGTIGEGKTTAICHLFNLIGDFKVTKNIGGKSRNVIETRELLSTGAGKTTICEVIIKAAEKTSIEIEPYTVDEMENIILEFCDYIANKDNHDSELKITISPEVERAIRNIIDMKLRSIPISDDEKNKFKLIDKAKELFDASGIEILKENALSNAKLESRTAIKVEYDNQINEREWIKRTFAAVNNAQLEEFAIPRKIYIYVSHDVLSGSNLSQFESVVDTKGLDEIPIRQDLETYIESQDTICLFATSFKDAPEANIRKLISYHLSSKSKDFHHRFITLVFPHKNEPEKVHGANEDWNLGIQIRKQEIQDTFKRLNLDFFLENILFYDAFRYYRDDIVKLNTDFYTEEDVQTDRNELLAAIAGIVERKRNILLDEIKNIRDSFTRIKNGEALTVSEIKAIEKAIQQIKDLRDLSKRIPSFVYEVFIDEYIEYYRTVYRAWNTKRAINRNFGYYKPRHINIYYDMRVVAQGKNEDEMLKKFTKQVKEELENILNELASANESFKTLIPELVIQFNSLYDDFISKVGRSVEQEAKRKLSPKNNKEFWKTLIDQRGKNYVDNVCQTFKRELEAEENLNRVLEIKATEHWKKVVNKILHFLGNNGR